MKPSLGEIKWSKTPSWFSGKSKWNGRNHAGKIIYIVSWVVPKKAWWLHAVDPIIRPIAPYPSANVAKQAAQSIYSILFNPYAP